MTEPREWTQEEIREQFIKYVWSVIEQWHNSTRVDDFGKLTGVAFSILTAIDGGAELPSFVLAPRPHETDKQFHIDEGENWYPEDWVDIGGGLHEIFHDHVPDSLKEAVANRRG